MKRIKTLRAKTGTYKDRDTGKEKNAYQTIGYLLEGDDGKMLKIDSIPVDFNGWVYFGDLESKPAQEAAASREQGVVSNQVYGSAEAQQEFDDDIPF